MTTAIEACLAAMRKDSSKKVWSPRSLQIATGYPYSAISGALADNVGKGINKLGKGLYQLGEDAPAPTRKAPGAITRAKVDHLLHQYEMHLLNRTELSDKLVELITNPRSA